MGVPTGFQITVLTTVYSYWLLMTVIVALFRLSLILIVPMQVTPEAQVCVCTLIAVLGYCGMELAAIISSFSYFIVSKTLTLAT